MKAYIKGLIHNKMEILQIYSLMPETPDNAPVVYSDEGFLRLITSTGKTIYVGANYIVEVI